MSPKRGDRAAPPPGPDEWDVRFGKNDAAKGWEQLAQQAPGNTLRAWQRLRTDPAPSPAEPRQHQLKGSLATAPHAGDQMPQWQIEVTGAGRIWYLVDDDRKTVWIVEARTGHPKATE